MKSISSAQADFRANDRDWNQVNDYWRGDIAGLYGLEVRGHAIKLIEWSLAAADDRPALPTDKVLERWPKAGFWFRALPHDGEKGRGPDRFAACSFPESLEAGRYGTYIVSEENTVRRRLLGHARGIEFYPPEGQLKNGEWTVID